MNLRFERNQIRIRVSQGEAFLLLDHKILQESFPYSNFAQPLQIQIQVHIGNFRFDESLSMIKIFVPQELLKIALQNPGKDPVCCLTASLQNLNTEIIFEVDRLKKREESNK